MARIDNNYFTYRQTPTTENGTGTLESIRGQTLNWNQLSKSNTEVGTIGGITRQIVNGLLSINGTPISATYQNRISFGGITIPQGHKVLLSGKSNHFYFRLQGNTSATTSNGGIIFTAGSDVLNDIVLMGSNLDTSATYNESFYPQIFDLTQMFGSGNEPTTVDQFVSYFPLSYYPYSQGELISFNGNGIKTVGFNLWDEEWETGGVSGTNGGIYNDSTRIRSKNYISVFPNMTYYIKAPRVFNYAWYDGNKQYISGDNSATPNYTRTSPNGARYLRFSTTGTTYNNDICINISSSRNGEYEPYTSSVLSFSLPTLRSANTIYDEVTKEENGYKHITIVGSITIDGSSSINFNGTTANSSNFVITVTDKANGQNNIKSNLFEVGNTTSPYKMIGRASSKIVEFALPSSVPQTVADGQAWFAQHPTTLFYELATPTESTLDLDLTFNIDQGGTEELLPSSSLNGSVDLGSATVVYNPDLTRFQVTMPSDYKLPTNYIDMLNLESAIYSPNGSPINNSGIDMTMSGYPNQSTVYINNYSYTDANAFKQAMQGVYIWYQKSDSTPSTTPISCDIFYRGMIPVSVNVYPLGSGTVTGSGEYRYGETATLVATSNDGIYRFLRYEDENGQTLSTDSTYSFKVGE